VKTRRPALALLAFALVAVGGLAACEPTPATGGTTTTAPSSATTPGAKAVAAARTQLGQPYVTGGESRAEGGFDCSGLTSYAWKQAGVTLPRSSAAQWTYVTKITKAQLQPGDFIFYSSGGPKGTVSHVALYEGGGKLIQAQKTGVPVKEQNADTWWSTNIVGYGRVPAAKLPKA